MATLRLNLLYSKQNLADLALEKGTLLQLEKITNRLKKSVAIDAAGVLKKKVKEGNRVVFIGGSKAAKLAVAALIGKELNQLAYSIDLSKLISKYIGETEKNLEQIFSRAEGKEWILFFDEAAALFGKRTEVKDSHDRFVNQEITFLLQRIADYKGLVLLATNLKENIDSAFIRRYQIVDFNQ